MAERVPIAHFADPQTAILASEFLGMQGFDAAFIDKSGPRSSAGGAVLVPRSEASAAYALLRKVSQGDYAKGCPGQSDMLSDVAIRLTQALRGTSHRASVFRDFAIPFGLLFVAAVMFFFVVPAVFERVTGF